MKCKLLSFIFFSALISHAFSQASQNINEDRYFLNDFVCKNWTTSNGLPGMTITTILQDKKGYIWLGAYEGLIRFDGFDFVTFSRLSDKKYDFSTAVSIFQDYYDNIWVGHNDDGISCISPDGHVKKFSVENGLANNKVNAICEDNDHNIWIGTASGICYLTPEHKIVMPPDPDEFDLDDINVVNLLCDSSGRVWISTASENNLFVWSNHTMERFTGITKIKNPSVHCVYQDSSDALWFGLSPHYAVRIKDSEEIVYNIGNPRQSGTKIESIIQDSNGHYWFATDAGITILHDGSYTYYNRKNGLIDNNITAILQDREQNIWISSNHGGLQKMSKGKFSTTHTSASINCITEDKTRNLTWIAADDGLLCQKNNSLIENKITRFCKGLRVRNVTVTADGEILISSYSKYPYIIVKADDSIQTWTTKDGIANMSVRLSIKASNGDYYICTTAGLSIISHKDKSVFTLSRKNGFNNHYFMCLYEDEKGRIWAGTNGDGVYVLKDYKIIAHYTSVEGLAGNIIFKIIQHNNLFWISTGSGITCFDEEKNKFLSLTADNGLGSNSIFQILFDDNQTAWITTNQNLISTSYSELEEFLKGTRIKLHVRKYGSSDGFMTNGITSVSQATIDSSGNIWFALTDGYSIYNPRRTQSYSFPPQTEIEQYSLDNVPYEYHGQVIVIPPSVKRLSIKYTGLSFVSSDGMTFSTRLTGFDQLYSDWTSDRSVSYTNLHPGRYRFMLMSRNNEGIQSTISTPVLIIKKPYFWQILWFWLAIALFTAAMIYYAVRQKIRNMLRYQTELEKKVAERTRQLKIANDKAESLLLNILPEEVARELTEHPDRTIAHFFSNVTVLFTDIVGFTKMSDTMSAEELVTLLNKMISVFDERAKREGIEKIKTIGDAYMAASGLKDNAGPEDTIKMIRFAQGILQDVEDFNLISGTKIEIRLGINTGSLVAGVIGKTKFIYDIWGDTVNVASRMESTGKPMRIHVTEATYKQTKDLFTYSKNTETDVKGKGKMKTYFL